MKKILLNTLSMSMKFFVIIVLIVSSLITWIIIKFPSDKEIRGCITTKLYHVELCPKSANYARIDQISKYMEKAVVLTEDSAFYNHKGFDFQEMENSMKKNLEKGSYARGGSTITQQLAKNLFLSSEKTLTRKIFEALITLRLEKVLSKKEILEKYLNVVQFGKDLYGIKPASEFYFKKSPNELSVVESAFLTFLLPSPEKYSKSYFTGKLTPFAEKRLNQIIENMHAYQRITDDEYALAKNELSSFLSGPPQATDVDYLKIDEQKVEDEENSDSVD